MKKIAVVILNWNGANLLAQFLPSVLDYSEEAAIYVADNASTDTSISLLKEQFPSVKIIENAGNFGFAQGYNTALQQVEEPYYALVNSDIEVTKDWLKPILRIFENESEVSIIQPKLKTRITLNMRELQAVLSINLVIPFAVDAFLIQSKKTFNNTMTSVIFFGPLALAFLSENLFLMN